MKGSLGGLVALAVAAAPAYAQDVATKGSATAQEREDVHEEGEYSGVVPGEASDGKPRASKRPLVTWIGFQPQDSGASRFFVQAAGSLDYDQDVVGNKLIVSLHGVRLGKRNVQRRLDTRFFDTSVRQVVTRRVRTRRARKGKRAQRAGVELTFEFKNPADARAAAASAKREQDGYDYLYLDFGPGTSMASDG